MRQCPLKYKKCPLKLPLSGRVVRSFDIQVAKTTNGQKNGSAEESRFPLSYARVILVIVLLESIFRSRCLHFIHYEATLMWEFGHIAICDSLYDNSMLLAYIGLYTNACFVALGTDNLIFLRKLNATWLLCHDKKFQAPRLCHLIITASSHSLLKLSCSPATSFSVISRQNCRQILAFRIPRGRFLKPT